MRKKKSEIVQEMTQPPRLTPEQYWEWRTTIAELDEAKKAVDIVNLQLSSLKKDVEILTLKSQLFLHTTVNERKSDLSAAEQEYLNTKKRIEGLLGISLNDKLIDAATFEVKDAPQSGS